MNESNPFESDAQDQKAAEEASRARNRARIMATSGRSSRRSRRTRCESCGLRFLVVYLAPLALQPFSGEKGEEKTSKVS